MNLNKVFLIGNLTADPELRTTSGGQSVMEVRVATNRTWTDKAGKRQEQAEFHSVIIWGRQAEIVKQFLTKGSSIFIEGRLQTRNWDDKQGLKHWKTEVICERMQLGPRSVRPGEGGFAKPQQADPQEEQKEGAEIPVINIDDTEEIKAEDLPF
ncbi:MAG: single-stranded DNA-binding protein [Candidatus Liptonbacteria bacterium]|nr:single-stranded DNA-binding protein [Candidatus Liptonbacteria bacterium]